MKSEAVARISVNRPPTRSGVFARHELESEAGIRPTVVPESTPGPASSPTRLRSIKRLALREELAPALEVAMGLAEVSDSDVAACIDEAPQRVQRMRAGLLPVTAEYLGCLARSRDQRHRDVFEYLVREMRGGQ